MQWVNTDKVYGWASIALHWIAAIGVLVMLVIGLRADSLGEAGDRAGRAAAMFWHISIGVTLIAFLLARVIAHYVQKQPEAPPQPKPLKLLSTVTHHALLLAIVLLIVSGPLLVWSGGRAINVFDVLSLPSPFAERNRGLHEIFETMHGIGRYMLYVVIPLHLLGVAKHVVLDRDGTLGRMLAPKPLKKSA